MRRLAILLAGGALWLFLAAIPTLADGGVHMANDASGANTLTADSCAGCHRAHTAQDSMLLRVPESELCLECHGSSGTMATTDVEKGIQYQYGSANTVRSGTELGALRAGGFVTARIGTVNRVTSYLTFSNGDPRLTAKGKVQASATDHTLTSPHMPELAANISGGTARAHVAWGSGTTGNGGASVSLECTSCHNPHGNNSYAILNNTINTSAGSATENVGPYTIANVAANATGTFTATAATGFIVGDTVTVVNGVTPVTTGAVATVPTAYSFTVTGYAGSGSAQTGLTVTRSNGVKVTDWNTVSTATRNYTVIQLGGTNSVLASQVTSYGSSAGDYFRRYTPWNSPTGTADAPNGNTSTFVGQMNNWCAQCHTRYLTNSHNDNRAGDVPVAGVTTGFMYQHKTNGTGSSPSCNLCHVSHGSNVAMTGQAASVPFPDTHIYLNADSSVDSRLLKVDNRGTCTMCHDPSGTAAGGSYLPNSGGSDIGTAVGTVATIAADGTVTLASGTVTTGDYIVIKGSLATRTVSSNVISFDGAYFALATGGSFQVSVSPGGAATTPTAAVGAGGTVKVITLTTP